jgi:putative ABC transport system permease protein
MMTMLRFYLRTASHTLRRGGQRVLVAMLCVAFGVMSLVAMLLVSQSVHSTLVVDPREQLGGDLSLGRPEEYILPEHVAELQALQAEGAIERYALAAQASFLSYRTPSSGESYLSATGIGIDPAVYPLAGALTVGDPDGAHPAALLQGVGDVLVTRDLQADHGLAVGDEIILTDLAVGAPVQGRVQGIVADTPNHMGDKIYYTLATAQALAGGRNAANAVLVTAGDPEAVRERLSESGWSVFSAALAAGQDRATVGLIDLLLRGAGMMGLFVGGIGIANTMQVLLRRRRQEMAIWKVLGYRERELHLLFATEAGLLGTFGSLLGAGLGLAISGGLTELFRRTGSMLYVWTISPLPLAAGVLVGIATTVVFALWAIATAGRVQPMALLRNEPVAAARPPRWQALLLAAVLALPLATITSLVMGSLFRGIGVLLFALAGLLALGGFMGALAWVATHLLPLQGLPLLRMARNSLRRRGLSPVFAMIALFAGVVSLALGVVFTQNAGQAMDERTLTLPGYNVTVTALAEHEEAVRQALAAQGIDQVAYGYQTSVRAIDMPARQEPFAAQPVLMGRSEPYDYVIGGAPWGSEPDGVYTYEPAQVPLGSTVEVTLWDGTVRTLTVVGSYGVELGPARLPYALGLLMPAELSLSIAPPDTVQFAIEAPQGQVRAVSASLGEALPQATVINLQAYATRFSQAYWNLFVLATAMAGLALLAGVLLVANSVSLAMLDRRYEIGVLKAVGYSRWHILATLAAEYGLVALIPTFAALTVVQGFLVIVRHVNKVAAGLLSMPPQVAALIGLVGVGLTLLTVLAVAWRPTQVSPVVVLNDRC